MLWGAIMEPSIGTFEEKEYRKLCVCPALSETESRITIWL